MASRAISEFDAKRLVSQHIKFSNLAPFQAVPIKENSNFTQLAQANPWVQNTVSNFKYKFRAYIIFFIV